MTREEVSSHSTENGNLHVMKPSQKGEASIYHTWKRQYTIYENCNHALAQVFSQIFVENFSYC